jgi:hypothetical protein
MTNPAHGLRLHGAAGFAQFRGESMAIDKRRVCNVLIIRGVLGPRRRIMLRSDSAAGSQVEAFLWARFCPNPTLFESETR